MKLDHINIGIIFLAVIVSGTSCVKKQSVDPVPVISFKSFEPYQKGVNAYLMIGFEDGDGDLLMSKENTQNSLFIRYLYKDVNGNFVPVLTPNASNPNKNDTLTFNYIVKRDTEDKYSGKSIKGDILIDVRGYVRQGDKSFKYKISLLDQKGNKSNEIETPEFIEP
ncbi:MAG: hypothetical protein QM534_06480 [Sediminibacterium sp.]|nr:hypothetical protein [Sediminibacterium sp.]